MAFGFFEPSKGEVPESIRHQRQVAAALAARVDGVVFSSAQVVQYQIGLRVREVTAGIEGHGQTRH